MSDSGYAGVAMLTLGGQDFEVMVRLGGVFDPIDGRYHWGGRIAPNVAVADAVRGGVTTGELTVDGERKPVHLKDSDPWGGIRLTAAGAPPRAVTGEIR